MGLLDSILWFSYETKHSEIIVWSTLHQAHCSWLKVKASHGMLLQTYRMDADLERRDFKCSNSLKVMARWWGDVLTKACVHTATSLLTPNIALLQFTFLIRLRNARQFPTQANTISLEAHRNYAALRKTVAAEREFTGLLKYKSHLDIKASRCSRNKQSTKLTVFVNINGRSK